MNKKIRVIENGIFEEHEQGIKKVKLSHIYNSRELEKIVREKSEKKLHERGQ